MIYLIWGGGLLDSSYLLINYYSLVMEYADNGEQCLLVERVGECTGPENQKRMKLEAICGGCVAGRGDSALFIRDEQGLGRGREGVILGVGSISAGN